MNERGITPINMNENTFEHFYMSTGICTDTRAIQKDSLFICIKGENFDGNTFATQALNNGAYHIILDNKKYYDGSENMTLVDDSIVYLQKLANFHRNKFELPVIGITGSNGKTTTKELINAVLSKKYKVLATKGNLNNHLGVPFTLLELNDSHEIAIIEMGANKFKDIEELCSIAEPNYGIITNIGKAHLEGFVDFNGVLKTKKELFDAVSNSEGKIIINIDDDTLMNILPVNINSTKYGTSNSSDVQGELVQLSPFVEMKWTAENYSSEILKTQMIGKYNFYNYLAAAAFGVEFNVNHEDISNAIISYSPTNRRSQVKETKTNTLILDCYNANPSSMKSAIESFAENNTPLNKLLILGTMGELGDDSLLEHQKVIELAEKLQLSGYFVGDEFSSLKSAAILKHFNSADELENFINNNHISNKLILLKGSRSVGLEKIEDYL